MNIRKLVKLSGLLFFFGMTLAAEAQWGWQNGRNTGLGYYTGGNYGWAGWGPGRGPRAFKPLGTVSINADFNYDGLIRGAEGRNLKMTPPGLVIGSDEMTKISLSSVPDPIWLPTLGDPKVNMKFHKLALILDVRGVDLGKKNGQFRSIEKEIEKCGRVLVWADKTRKHLLLDSSDPSRRRLVWAYADSVPLQHVYVEGVDAAQPGGAYLITWELDDSYGQNAFQRFFGDPSVWDRLMVSIRPTGNVKPLIDSDPVWIKFYKPAYSKN
jgi:hypothetical protein